MMKKKNVALAMAAVSATGAIPVLVSADTVADTQNNITVNEYSTLEAKLKDMLSKKYSTKDEDLTTNATVTTGGAVYTIEMNTTGQSVTTIDSVEDLKVVSNIIKESKLGTVFNFKIVDNGHVVKSNGVITNMGVNKYTISDLVKLGEPGSDIQKEIQKDIDTQEKLKGYTVNAKFIDTKSETVIEIFDTNKKLVYTRTLKVGDEKLDFKKAETQEENGVLKITGFAKKEEVIAPATHIVSVANAKQEKITVSEEEISTIVEELKSKYEFSDEELDRALQNIELVDGKYQVILFANDIKLTKSRALTPDGTLAQILLTADTKQELVDLINALKGDAEFTKIIGEDRIDTAIKLSESEYADGEASHVVLVGQTAIVDGLASAPLAAKHNAPILLTETDSLTEEVKDEIKRVMGLTESLNNNKEKTVYIAGGEAVVSADVEAELLSMGIKVKRLAGEDRFETSLEIAEEVGTTTKAYVVGGYGLADAMSIAPVAAMNNAPIVVVDGINGLSEEATSFLKDFNSADVIGGEAVVDATVLSEVAKATGSAKRVAGDDRQETNAEVITEYFTNTPGKVYVAKDGYTKEDLLVDALAAAPIAGKNNAPIVLATDSLTIDQTIAVNKVTADTGNKLTQVGGGVAESVISSLKKLLGL